MKVITFIKRSPMCSWKVTMWNLTTLTYSPLKMSLLERNKPQLSFTSRVKMVRATSRSRATSPMTTK